VLALLEQPVKKELSHLEERFSLSAQWPILLAWGFGLLALILALAAWVFLGLAVLTPLVANQAVLTAVLLGPVIGAASAAPGVACALLATRRAKVSGESPVVPVMLVGLATAVLVGGLLFGGLVSYPRARLGTFGLAIQMHCARFAQSLEPYGNPPEINKLEQDPLELSAKLRGDQADLASDQAALNALHAPDPAYQPLLDDCRSLTKTDMQVTNTLVRELVALPPDVSAAQKTMTQYLADTKNLLAEIQRLGAALQQQVYAPLHPA
jgi:hypothetical protein